MNLVEAYYNQRYENAFLRAKGDSFQELFEKLMGLAYKADFMACRPWGNRGDKKNDGFLKSEKRLFQVYAPNEMDEATAKKKIGDDFAGAKIHWGIYFDKWVFAHNAVDGLPPHVQELILDLETKNAGIKLEPWCLEEFRKIFSGLPLADKENWFGLAPNENTANALSFTDLQLVLEGIANQPVAGVQSVKDVPMGKIEANALSASVAHLLKVGMIKSPLVEEFFATWHDETLGERVAESFRQKYRELRGTKRPDDIFADLQVWAGGKLGVLPKLQVAVLAILSYFFNTCDIFEEPRSVTA